MSKKSVEWTCLSWEASCFPQGTNQNFELHANFDKYQSEEAMEQWRYGAEVNKVPEPANLVHRKFWHSEASTENI